VNVLDGDSEDGKIIALQSLSNAQLIQILQHHDGDDDLTLRAERRKARRNDQCIMGQRDWSRINRRGNRVPVR
jgi:hypothetical protein